MARVPLPEQLKYGFEDLNDVYEMEYLYTSNDGCLHFQQYKNGERIRGSVSLTEELMIKFGVEL